VASVREQTILTKRPPLASEVSANFLQIQSARHTYGCILGFLDRNRYFFFQVAPQLYSRGWVDPVPDPLLLRKSGSTGNRTRTSGSVARNWPLDHRGSQILIMGNLQSIKLWRLKTALLRAEILWLFCYLTRQTSHTSVTFNIMTWWLKTGIVEQIKEVATW
jgi:hypothetical protein